jgi:hypothetical protein
MRTRPQATCHPDKPHYCRGLCRACYRKEPSIQQASKKWRKSAVRKRWQKKYDKTPIRASCYRRWKHGFTPADEQRFISALYCDWCFMPFNGELPDIDHAHTCCAGTGKHCSKCTRGFVHHKCNIMAIAYFEWLEKTFGVSNGALLDYRRRFPVPRIL